MDKILDTRKVNGRREYLILWKDYGIDDATWEGVEHCDCPDAIAAFHKERKEASAKGFVRDPSIVRNETKLPVKTPNGDSKSARRRGHVKVPLVKHGTVKKYQVQRGRRIESIVGVNTTGKELMFMVRYRGAEPHHQRSEFVPSSVLRQHALEDFINSLEQLAVINGPFVNM